MNNTEDRIQRLERSLGIHRTLSAAVLVVGGLCIGLGAAGPGARHLELDTIEARRLVIRGPAGDVRAVLEARDDFAAFEMLDAKGLTRVSLSSPGHTLGDTRFTIFDASGESRFEVLAETKALNLRMSTFDPESVSDEREREVTPYVAGLILACDETASLLSMGNGNTLNTTLGVTSRDGSSNGFLALHKQKLVGPLSAGERQTWAGGTYFGVKPDGRVDLPESKFDRR